MQKSLWAILLPVIVFCSCSKGKESAPAEEVKEDWQIEATINGVRTKFNVTGSGIGRNLEENKKSLYFFLYSEDKQHSLILSIKNDGATGNEFQMKKYDVVKLPAVDDSTTDVNESLVYPRDVVMDYSERMADGGYLSLPLSVKGEIVLTENDTEKMMVSGTFSSEMRTYSTQKLKLTFTNGKFRNIKYNNISPQ